MNTQFLIKLHNKITDTGIPPEPQELTLEFPAQTSSGAHVPFIYWHTVCAEAMHIP